MLTKFVPKLSVIIPIYNQTENLSRLLASIARYPLNIETIIVNYTEKTNSCIDYPSANIQYFYGSQGRPSIEPLLQAIEAANAPCLMFTQPDSIFLDTDGLKNIVTQFLSLHLDILGFCAMDAMDVPVGQRSGNLLQYQSLYQLDIIKELTTPLLPLSIFNKLYNVSTWKRLLPKACNILRPYVQEDIFLLLFYLSHAHHYLSVPEFISENYQPPPKTATYNLRCMLTIHMMEAYFAEMLQKYDCNEQAIQTIMQNLQIRQTSYAMQYLRDFALISNSNLSGESFLTEALSFVPPKELLKILLTSNAYLAQALTREIGAMYHLTLLSFK